MDRYFEANRQVLDNSIIYMESLEIDMFLNESKDEKDGVFNKIKRTIKKIIKWIQDKIEPLAIKIEEISGKLAQQFTKISARLRKTKNPFNVRMAAYKMIYNAELKDLKDSTIEEFMKRVKTSWDKDIQQVKPETVSKLIDNLVKKIADARKNIIVIRKELLKAKRELTKLERDDKTNPQDVKVQQNKVKELNDELAASRKLLSVYKEGLKVFKKSNAGSDADAIKTSVNRQKREMNNLVKNANTRTKTNTSRMTVTDYDKSGNPIERDITDLKFDSVEDLDKFMNRGPKKDTNNVKNPNKAKKIINTDGIPKPKGNANDSKIKQPGRISTEGISNTKPKAKQSTSSSTKSTTNSSETVNSVKNKYHQIMSDLTNKNKEQIANASSPEEKKRLRKEHKKKIKELMKKRKAELKSLSEAVFYLYFA